MPKRTDGLARPNRPVAGQIERTILIVEDDSLLADLLERKLRQEGFSCRIATNSREADQALGVERIDLVLLDLVLPGMDGITYLRKLKEDPQRRTIPVIIISNLMQEEEIKRGIAAGAIDYITKARTTPGQIVRRVRAYFSPKGQKARARV